uniref:C2 domain-containing protein n=1 Tax=Panagrolaimus sp. ES5 TaxID=591445 RepID=A0AC34F4P9_9BILA
MTLVKTYYTHQIDLFDKEMNPIEVKALCFSGDKTKTKEEKLSECFTFNKKVDTVLQCKIGGVKKVILGLHDGKNNDFEIIRMDLEELDIGSVERKVKKKIQINSKELEDKNFNVAAAVKAKLAYMKNGLKIIMDANQ